MTLRIASIADTCCPLCSQPVRIWGVLEEASFPAVVHAPGCEGPARLLDVPYVHLLEAPGGAEPMVSGAEIRRYVGLMPALVEVVDDG